VVIKGRFLLYDDRQEKQEEWDLMFVKAQPGVAKVKRKDQAGAESSILSPRSYNSHGMPNAPSPAGLLYFFELLTREETVRFLSPSKGENAGWVEVINQQRDMLVAAMLEDESDDIEDEDNPSVQGGGGGKLGIAESRRLLREIIESNGNTTGKDPGLQQESEPPGWKTGHLDSESSNLNCADCGEPNPGAQLLPTSTSPV